MGPASIQRDKNGKKVQKSGGHAPELLKTIHLPKNLKNLGNRLPKAKYDDEITISISRSNSGGFINPQDPEADESGGISMKQPLYRNSSLPILPTANIKDGRQVQLGLNDR